MTEESLAKLNAEDGYEEELIVMAETSAYFRVAYKVRPILRLDPFTLAHAACSA